jgi:hypothetical protein
MTPQRLGRYDVRQVLGRGGMGVVYEGHDPQIDRPVAIKTIALDGLSAAEAAEFEARFRAEMRSAGRLLHQNIVALYDTGRDEGTAFIVMELVHGLDLRQRLAAGECFNVAQAVQIGLQLLAALEYAHARQVVHRDVKPANLMLQTDGRVKLCDFGVARLTDVDATRTQGSVVGTVRYAAPEQLAGGPVDARTDLYAAAVVMHELLAGKTLFDGRSDVEILQRIAQQVPLPPSASNAEVPPALDAVLLRALSKDPAQRFASAAELAAAVRAATGLPPASDGGSDTTLPLLPPSAAPRSLRWRRAAALGVPLAIAAGWLVWAATTGDGPLQLDGRWTGLYSCGETLGPRNPGTGGDAFSANLDLEVVGERISWTRGNKTYRETVSGRIDRRGRFSAEGEGNEDNGERKSRWLVRASGVYNTGVSPSRLDGTVELLRPKDRSVSRRCTMSAVPR